MRATRWGCGCEITADHGRANTGMRGNQSMAQRCCPACEAAGKKYMHPADIEGRMRVSAEKAAGTYTAPPCPTMRGDGLADMIRDARRDVYGE
jgi:hypothetical protein